jgi:hypothetical protein
MQLTCIALQVDRVAVQFNHLAPQLDYVAAQFSCVVLQLDRVAAQSRRLASQRQRGSVTPCWERGRPARQSVLQARLIRFIIGQA